MKVQAYEVNQTPIMSAISSEIAKILGRVYGGRLVTYVKADEAGSKDDVLGTINVTICTMPHSGFVDTIEINPTKATE